MRHLISAFILVAGFGTSRAFATPFEPSTIPDQAGAVGHLDMDALRKTQVFTALSGQATIDAALDRAPAELRPLAHAVAAAVRGISFWRGAEHGAVYVETRDPHALAQILAKAPVVPGATVDGVATFTGVKPDGDDHGFGAVVGDTLVLADSAESLATSIHTLRGKGPSLVGSRALPAVTRTGVFVFVTLGSDALSAIQKSASAKLLQLGIRSIVVDVRETAGVLAATAHAEMGSAEATQKAKSIVEGLRALASVSLDTPRRVLLDRATVTANGLALDVVANVPVTELATLIQSK
jgi:hypothetical protein